MNTPGISAGDTAWVLGAAALVFVMNPGLAFFYAGLVRRKNTLNTLMMTYVAMGVGAVVWMVAGYSLAFAPGSPFLGSLRWLGLCGVGGAPEAAYAPTIPALAFFAFQGMFATITPALVSGAIVERMSFRAYVAFLALWSLLVYAPVAHWVWGAGGFLHAWGALDFAGGTVVHVTAGTAALVAARILGPRQDFKRIALIPHNVPYVLLGAGLLWFGWFGFNAGSALAANGTASLAFVTTNAGAAAAALTWLALENRIGGHATAVGAATGAVVGLVGITPGAGFVSPLSGLAIGALTAIASFTALRLRGRTSLDDTLDVFACHGIGGITGSLLTGVFASKAANPDGADGLIHGNVALLGIQAATVGVVFLYTLIVTSAVLVLIKAVTPLRVELHAELDGLDRRVHGEEAYRGGSAAGGLGESVILLHSERAHAKTAGT
ncbi:MAG TPA: ammonium transporter [Thermoanaerobaculia bacterium]|nr:ammonium transporter [Thermoanaerobaculia bacterium]